MVILNCCIVPRIPITFLQISSDQPLFTVNGIPGAYSGHGELAASNHRDVNCGAITKRSIFGGCQVNHKFKYAQLDTKFKWKHREGAICEFKYTETKTHLTNREA